MKIKTRKQLVLIGMVVLMAINAMAQEKAGDYRDYPIWPADGKLAIHYRPAAPYVFGDPTPFYWNGEYHVFFLRSGDMYEWSHVVSKDLVNWIELPLALGRGKPGEHDHYKGCATGSVIEHEGTFHAYYVIFNAEHPNGVQQIGHAISKDLIQWTKHPEHTFFGDGIYYWNKTKNPPLIFRPDDEAFRDPYVFWNEDENCWWMVLTARNAKTQEYCTGVLTSTDLIKWKAVKPLENAGGADCPDLFQSNGKWYRIFNFSEYNFANKVYGPYYPDSEAIISPGSHVRGSLRYDTERLFVPKRMFDGRRHVLVGFIPDLRGGRDDGEFQYGGCMSIPREVYGGTDGLLYQRPVPEITALYAKTIWDLTRKPQPIVETGNVIYDGSTLIVGDHTGQQSRCTFESPNDYMTKCRVQLDKEATFSLIMRKPNGDAEGGYRLTIHPQEGIIELSGFGKVYSRKCAIDVAKPIEIQAFVDGGVIECFVNDMLTVLQRALTILQMVILGLKFPTERHRLRY